MSQLKTEDFSLSSDDKNRLASLCGQFNENLSHIERRLGVEINCRANRFRVIGKAENVKIAAQILKELYQLTATQSTVSPEQVHLSIQEKNHQAEVINDMDEDEVKNQLSLSTKRGNIKPRGNNQAVYVRKIITKDISFGVGPAGTGKTYLAVAAAVDALQRQEVRRIVLTRPAVEAGERLGFLPGDLAQKVDPYLRPLYDALYEMLGFEKVAKLIEQNIIEIAPLAYMRGRTLNESFIILDESQNTTKEQMKMFLTRIGFGSKAVITGDITQIDLPRGVQSGLRQAIEVLRDVDDVSFTFFQASDVVRHPVVQSIVQAYEKFDLNNE